MFLTRRFFIALLAIAALTAGGYVLAPLYSVGMALLWLLVLTVVVETVLLWSKRGIRASRRCEPRFSNGDPNAVDIDVESSFGFPLRLTIVDEAPFVFQRRDISFRLRIGAHGTGSVGYSLRPTSRGVCAFGDIRVFASALAGLVERRFTCPAAQQVKVYPSYVMLSRYEFLAIHNHLSEMGLKRIRRAGNSTEFEQIKDYTPGDDYRRINWKATARLHRLMTNAYQDERSQQIVSIIDKGRLMQQSFEDMTLFDYAINATLVLSYIAMRKDDRAGMATVCQHMDNFVAPSSRPGHMQTLLETLYGLSTNFGETDLSTLVAELDQHLTRRSLVVLYTNFCGRESMERQLPFLRQLNRRHRLLVVCFVDTALADFVGRPATTDEERHQQAVARQMLQDQQLAASLLQHQGVLCLLTRPAQLSVNVINKYLELKSANMLV